MSDTKKRKRTSLVCETCRKKKVKCDKGQPCGQCVKAGKSHNCVYDQEALSQLQNPNTLPYLNSAKIPMAFNGTQMFSARNNESLANPSGEANRSETSNNGEISYSDRSTRTELELLKERLMSIERSMSEQSSRPNQDNSNYNSTTDSSGASSINRPRTDSASTNSTSLNYSKSIGGSSFSSSIPGNNKSEIHSKPSTPADGTNGNVQPSSTFAQPHDFAYRSSPFPPHPNPEQKLAFPANEKTPDFPYFLNNTSFPASNTVPLQKDEIKLPPINNAKSTNSAQISRSYIPKFSNDQTFSMNEDYTRFNDPNLRYSDSHTASTEQSSNSAYADTPDSESTNIGLGKSVNALNGHNPYGSPDDTINFYEGYKSVYIKDSFRRISFGPFSWSSLMQKDTGLKLLWDHTLKMKESSAKTALIFTNKDSEISAETTSVLTSAANDTSINLDEKVFEKRLLEPEGINDMIPYYKLKKSQVEKTLEKSKSNQSTLPLGLTFYNGKIENELRLIDKIQVFLPKKKVVWKLIHIFFMDIYPFMPFLEEECFRQAIEDIIGPCSYDDVKIEKLKVEKRLDLAFLGILLIMIRLSYLSLFTNRNDINEHRLNTKDPITASKAYNYLLSNPITINIIDIAQECLDQFNLFRKPSVPVLQLAFYMKLYHTYAPEDGDGADGGDASGMLALLTQMAVSLGFHREPDTYMDSNATPQPSNNIGRKIWHYLVLNDLHLGYTFGTPIGIARGCYDTKVPFYRNGEESLVNKELDKFVTTSLFRGAILYLPFRNILHLVLNVEGYTKMSEICKGLTDFELLITKEYGTLTDCLNPEAGIYSDFTRTFKTKFYLSVKSFYIIIYYYFYLYYEQRNINLSFFYMKKILLISISEVMPHYFDLIGNIKFDLILNPSVEQVIHKSNQIMIALVIRCNFIIYNMKTKPEHETKCDSDINYYKYYKSLCTLSASLTRCLEVSIAVISKISNRYYHAWRITKGHTYLLRTITKKEFYEMNYPKASTLSNPLYSIDQILELTQICEHTLSVLGKESKYFFSPEIFDEFKSELEDKEGETGAKPQTPYSDMKTPKFVSSQDAGVRGSPFSPGLGNTLGNNSNSNKNESAATASESVPKSTDFDLGFVNSAEIDKLWLQVLSSKQDFEPEDGNTRKNSLAVNQNLDLNAANFTENDFDIFSTIPLEGMFPDQMEQNQ